MLGSHPNLLFHYSEKIQSSAGALWFVPRQFQNVSQYAVKTSSLLPSSRTYYKINSVKYLRDVFAVLHMCMKCLDCGAVVELVSEAKFKFSQRRKSIIQKCPSTNRTFTFKSRFIESRKRNTVLTCTSQGRARAPSPRVKTKVQKHNKAFHWAGF